MSNRMGVAVLEFRNDHLCHMANPADDTLAELARIVGSGATLSPASDPSDHSRPAAPRLVETPPVDRRVSEQPTPEAPVVVDSNPSMIMDVIDAPASRFPDTPQATSSELPAWAQATSESAPRFDFDLQNRLQEAFGTRVASEKSAFERVVEEAPELVAPTIEPEPEPEYVAPRVTEQQSYSSDADELDAALSAELDRVLADEMAESDADYASPELKAKDDFEAELARMFLPDPAVEPASVEPVAEPTIEMTRQPVHEDTSTPTHSDADLASMQPAPQRQAPVIVDPIFAEADVASAAVFKETATASRGRGKAIALAIAAVALLGGTAAVALNFVGGESGPPPVIMADNTPAKEKPADPGGESVPNQDQAVYKSVEGRSNADLAQPTLFESEETPIQVTNVGSADSSAANALAPRTVRTVTVRPDGTIVGSTQNNKAPRAVSVTNVAEDRFGDQATSAAANPIGPEAETPVVTPPPVAPEPVAVAESEVAAPEVVAPAPVVPTPAPEPVEVAKVEPTPAPAPAPPAPEPAASSPYKVQISSQRSEAAAKSSYETMSRRYASVIGGKGVDYQRTEIAGKGIYYRVRIPAASRSEANDMCSRLKSAGGSCFVTR